MIQTVFPFRLTITKCHKVWICYKGRHANLGTGSIKSVTKIGDFQRGKIYAHIQANPKLRHQLRNMSDKEYTTSITRVFQKEVAYLKKFKESPGIAKLIYKSDGINGSPGFIMKYYEADLIGFSNVEELAKNKRYQLQIMKQLAYAIRTLHENLCVHGDLKPENILLSFKKNNQITVGLTDFHSLLDFSQKPPASIFDYAGTLCYHPPELLHPKKKRERITLINFFLKKIKTEKNREAYLATKMEMWALGLTLHLIWFGDFPGFFENVDLSVEMRRQASRTWQIKSGFCPPSGLIDMLIWALLHPNPLHRPDIYEVIEILDHL